jgi:hypothetical protein
MQIFKTNFINEWESICSVHYLSLFSRFQNMTRIFFMRGTVCLLSSFPRLTVKAFAQSDSLACQCYSVLFPSMSKSLVVSDIQACGDQLTVRPPDLPVSPVGCCHLRKSEHRGAENERQALPLRSHVFETKMFNGDCDVDCDVSIFRVRCLHAVPSSECRQKAKIKYLSCKNIR